MTEIDVNDVDYEFDLDLVDESGGVVRETGRKLRDLAFDEVSHGSSGSGSTSDGRGMTIWAKVRFDEMDCDIELDRSIGGIENYPFCRIRTFEDRVLAERYLDFLDRYFELHPELGISELYLKKDGDPVYQIYFVTPVGDIEIVSGDDDDNNDEGLWFDYSEMLEHLKALKAGNPECEFHFREVEIDDQSEILEIPGV